MYLSEFLCASFDQCNIPGLRTRKKSPIDKLNLQTLAIFAAKCGKFFNFFVKIFGKTWQNLGFQMSIFRDASFVWWWCFGVVVVFVWWWCWGVVVFEVIFVMVGSIFLCY